MAYREGEAGRHGNDIASKRGLIQNQQSPHHQDHPGEEKHSHAENYKMKIVGKGGRSTLCTL